MSAKYQLWLKLENRQQAQGCKNIGVILGASLFSGNSTSFFQSKSLKSVEEKLKRHNRYTCNDLTRLPNWISNARHRISNSTEKTKFPKAGENRDLTRKNKGFGELFRSRKKVPKKMSLAPTKCYFFGVVLFHTHNCGEAKREAFHAVIG